jgi:hypothetical protein
MPHISNPFVHIVFFWLKEPGNDQHRKQFEECIHRFLNNSQYASSWHVGTPAGTVRPVVDNSWTYSLMVTFESAEKQDWYQAEPAHLRFIEEAGPLWERVQVYDTLAG